MPFKKKGEKEAMAIVTQLGLDINSVGEKINDDEKKGKIQCKEETT